MKHKSNFWHSLPKPFLALAPMENVTDTVFRQIVAKVGKPDVFFTEFTSTDGMCSIGRSEVDHRLQFTPIERPLVAQIWGTNPDHFYKTAQILADLGFDGIDINMGCPVRKVTNHGSCSALIKTPALAAEIIQATKQGAKSLPVSVKTRIGFHTIVTEAWLTHLLNQDIAALTVHGRTAKEESKVPAHWDEIGKAVAIRNTLRKPTLIIGNGDVRSRQQAYALVNQYQLDGIMIGRGIFENVWLFNPDIDPQTITPRKRFALLEEHMQLFVKTWGTKKNFAIMRKFVKAYVHGFSGASDIRVKLMETTTPMELKKTIETVSPTVPTA